MRFRALLAATALVAGVAVSGAAPAAAQGAPPPAPEPAAAPQPAVDPAPPPADPDPAALARIKRKLTTSATLTEGLQNAPPPTFRVSVSERIDIWKYWGTPDAVAAFVHPSGGPWHHEFVNMVTPDEYKGYGGILSNGDKAQLAATSLAFAGAMQLIGAGINKAKDALQTRRRRLAREEVQRELAAFCAATPGACPDGGPAPP